MATLMLENGVDIRFIQAILGHVTLDATEEVLFSVLAAEDDSES